MNPIIGAGEHTLVKILDELYPSSTIKTQVPLSRLLKGGYLETMSERQIKETVDVTLQRKYDSRPIIFRVQGKDHMGLHKSNIDVAQKHILEACDYQVVDIWYLDASELFKDNLNNVSRAEVKKILKYNNIKF